MTAVPNRASATPATAELLAFDGLPMPMAQLDTEGRVVRVNPAFVALVDISAVRLTGKLLSAQLESVASQTDIRGETTTYGFGEEGSERWLRFDLSRSDCGGLAILADVTYEYGSLRRIRADFASRDQLMHDAEVGTWRYDPDSEIYYFSSELALDHKAAGPPVPLATLQLIQHRDDRSIDTPIRERLTREGGSAEAEMRYRDGNGGWRTLRGLYRSGQMLPSGRYEMFGLSHNITALAEARDEANTNAQRLRLALKAAHAGVFEYDYKNRTYWLSTEFRELVGQDTLKAATNEPFAIFHADDREAARAISHRALTATQSEPIDVRVLRPEGCLWVRLYWETERDEAGQARRGVGLMLDIDVQKRQELALTDARQVAEAATASKSNFLASVSHEIRTPMNGIVGVLHLLKREDLSVEGRDLLGEALSCSDMLSQLINDVLDFSKMEAGKLDISPTPTDPLAVLDSVIALLQPQADVKDLYLRARAEPMGWADLDPVRLRQCLFNVIGNAVKFT